MMLKPKLVCDCGYIFEGLYCKPLYKNMDGLKIIDCFAFTPSRCPQCGEFIEGVEYPVWSDDK